MFRGDGCLGQRGEDLQVDRLVGVAQVQELVPHPAPLGGSGLGGAHIHPPVELAGIHRDHRQIKGLGQLHGQVGLAAGCWPHQGDGHGLERPGCFARLRWSEVSGVWNAGYVHGA